MVTGKDMYNVMSIGELTSILDHFDDNYVISTISYHLDNRLNDSIYQKPNTVIAFEDYFKHLLFTVKDEPDLVAKVNERREGVYRTIIDKLCSAYNLSFTENKLSVPVDIFAAANFAFDILISNFNVYFVDFFAKFIYKEKNDIYNSLHLEELKRNKDTSTVYNKKTIADSKLSIINANIDYVVRNIMTYDIKFENIIENIAITKDVSDYLKSIFSDNGDFFKCYFAPIVDTLFYHFLLTNIRLKIHQYIQEKGEN